MIYINKAKYAEMGRQMRALPLEKTVSSHRWEEIVEKMCASDDAGLHDRGIEELNKLKSSR